MGVVESVLRHLANEPAVWKSSLKAQKLWHMFRDWSDNDLWSALRRFHQLDKGMKEMSKAVVSISQDECAHVSGLKDSRLLFLWDFLSEDDQSCDAKLLITCCCLFSGCSLRDKGRFLLGVFDSSFTGVITGHELSCALKASTHILNKCFKLPISLKDFSFSLRVSLATLLPLYKELLHKGGNDVFKSERVIGLGDFNILLDSIEPLYLKLPISDTHYAFQTLQRGGPKTNETGQDKDVLKNILYENQKLIKAESETIPPIQLDYKPIVDYHIDKPHFARDQLIDSLQEQLNRANETIRALQTSIPHESICCCKLMNCDGYRELKESLKKRQSTT